MWQILPLPISHTRKLISYSSLLYTGFLLLLFFRIPVHHLVKTSFALIIGWFLQANDSRKELYEKEKEILDLRQEGLELNLALKDANDQCILLFNEVQKAWKVSFTLQADLKVPKFTHSCINSHISFSYVVCIMF